MRHRGVCTSLTCRQRITSLPDACLWQCYTQWTALKVMRVCRLRRPATRWPSPWNSPSQSLHPRMLFPALHLTALTTSGPGCMPCWTSMPMVLPTMTSILGILRQCNTASPPVMMPQSRSPTGAYRQTSSRRWRNTSRDSWPSVIVESHSPYAAPVVLVRKKDGSLRLCVDYRRLNLKTVGDAYPLPRIQESLDALVGAQYFSTLDLASGYHQISMDPRDQHKTAFTTPFSLYEYTRMPMGLASAPATFQRLMQATMSDFAFQFLLVYLDDLLVYSKTFDEHMEHLERLLQRVTETGLKLKASKCQFLRREVTYLGHTISADGVSCESGKVECVQNWPTPTTTTELRSFLGFASYYRRFISGFARIAGPLHDLVSEGAKHSKKKAADVSRLWGPKHQEAFDSLKEAMTTAPVLGYNDYTKPFILETDASHDGLSAILSQEQDGKSRVLAFASRRLRPSEKNSSLYSSMKLEFLAMKWAITDKFRHYLLGGKFKVITDNNPLTYFRSAKLGALEQRWASQLAQFNFDIQYRPGKINPADALARMHLKPSPEPLLTVVPPEVATVKYLQCEQLAVDPTPTAGVLGNTMAPVLPLDKEEEPDQTAVPEAVTEVLPRLSLADLQQLQQQDPVLGPVHAAWPAKPSDIKERSMRALVQQYPRLFLKKGVLHHRQADQRRGTLEQLVLPSSLRPDVLASLHDDMGHQGYKRTMELLRPRVYWPAMYREVREKWAVHDGPCTSAPHHFQSSACQPSPWNPGNRLHEAWDC